MYTNYFGYVINPEGKTIACCDSTLKAMELVTLLNKGLT